MRSALTATLVLLFLPLNATGQAGATAGGGHFDGWPSTTRWGSERQTFDVKFGFQGVDALFAVAQNGFGWRRAFTDSPETFNAWTDITAWCTAEGTVALRTKEGRPQQFAIYGLTPEDHATIVESYFRRYAPAAEWKHEGWQCTAAALGRPHPADAAKILELLKGAAEKR